VKGLPVYEAVPLGLGGRVVVGLPAVVVVRMVVEVVVVLTVVLEVVRVELEGGGFVRGRHWEYHWSCMTQVLPLSQQVGPAQLLPPHCCLFYVSKDQSSSNLHPELTIEESRSASPRGVPLPQAGQRSQPRGKKPRATSS
jgi:hypothetical protein